MIFFLDAGDDTDSTQIRRKQTCMDTEALRFVITDDLKAVIFGTHLEGDSKPIAPLTPATLLQQCNILTFGATQVTAHYLSIYTALRQLMKHQNRPAKCSTTHP